MNKLWLFFLCILSGCSLKQAGEQHKATLAEWMTPNGKLKVLATTGMISDIVKEVGKGHVDTYTLIQGDLDPHSYQLVKGDDEKLAYADILFFSGLGLEHGPSLQRHLIGNPKAHSIGEYIMKMDPSKALFVDSVVDPHIWMDISLWKFSIPFVVRILSDKDPVHAESFRKLGQELYNQFDAADQEVRALLLQIPEEKRYLVTSHDAFNYFTRRYLATDEEREFGGWQKRFAAPEGLSPDSQLSSHEIQSIIDHLAHYRIHTLFPESNLSKDSIRKIVQAGQEKGLKLKVNEIPLYGDAMGPIASPGETYLGMIRHNAKTIYDTIQGQ